MIMAAPGSLSEGFTMSVFPVAMAIGMVQSGIMLLKVQLERESSGKVDGLRREVEGCNTAGL